MPAWLTTLRVLQALRRSGVDSWDAEAGEPDAEQFEMSADSADSEETPRTAMHSFLGSE
jgi:hypothetical protein